MLSPEGQEGPSGLNLPAIATQVVDLSIQGPPGFPQSRQAFDQFTESHGSLSLIFTASPKVKGLPAAGLWPFTA